MKSLALIVCLFAASPAFSQTRMYTKADLGQPLSPNRVTVTAEQLASLVAHQFQAPAIADGPMVTIIGSASAISGETFTGPFGAFPPIPPPRRLDGSSFDVPPWGITTYGGRSFHGRGAYGRGRQRVHDRCAR